MVARDLGNALGNPLGRARSSSGGVAAPRGEITFFESGTFTVPVGVTSVSVVCVAAGGGGSCGTNSGVAGGTSSFGAFVQATGGAGADTVGVVDAVGGAGTAIAMPGIGGGNGGLAKDRTAMGNGGGGAGGYSGNGGDGATSSSGNGSAGSGGGGGGGAGEARASGGGVGLFGLGPNGAGGIYSGATARGGSGGRNGTSFILSSGPSFGAGGGGFYGGGGGGLRWMNAIEVIPYAAITVTVGAGGSGGQSSAAQDGTPGGHGAVRILWGAGRAFPSTDVGAS